MSLQFESKTLEKLTAHDIRAGLDRQAFSSETLVLEYQNRIKNLGPKLKAIAFLNPHAVERARQADNRLREMLSQGEKVPFLHGMPSIISDGVCSLENSGTTAGFSGLIGARPKEDADIVKRLHENGAIILGAAVTTPWLGHRDPRVPDGWTAATGFCVGPFTENQHPGGSSSGSAAVVSSGLAAFAVAINTIGGMSYSARQCGVAATMPTAALLPMAGVLQITEWDRLGIFAKSAAEARSILAALIEPTRMTTELTEPALTDTCPRVLVDTFVASDSESPEVTFQINDRYENVKSILSSLGYDLTGVNVRTKVHASKKEKNLRDFWTYSNLASRLEAFLSLFKENSLNIRTFADIDTYTRKNPSEKHAEFGSGHFESYERALAMPHFSTMRTSSLEQTKTEEKLISQLLGENGCSVLAVPVGSLCIQTPGSYPQVCVPMKPLDKGAPEIKAPCGRIEFGPNIPTSVMFVGLPGEDQIVLDVASKFERATRHRESYHFYHE